MSQMLHGNPILQLALSHVPLFPDAALGGFELLVIAAEVSGLSVEQLARARREMMMTGSLAPLRRLLLDPGIAKTDGLRYQLVGEETKFGLGHPEQHLRQRIELSLGSARGRIHLRLSAFLGSNKAPNAERQVMRIGLTGAWSGPSCHQSFKHEMILARDRQLRSQTWARAA